MDCPPQKVAIVERWLVHRGLNKSQCMDCPPKKVVVVERWQLVEDRSVNMAGQNR